MKRRTAFETVLVRRVAKKADYIRYVTYEMTLEELRKKRIERLSESLNCLVEWIVVIQFIHFRNRYSTPDDILVLYRSPAVSHL